MTAIRWEECAYFMRGLPGADPEGTCSFGCREEPNCMTGRPSEGWSPWDAQVERLGSQCAALTAEVARLGVGVEEAWVIMFGDEHLLSASPAGDICESCGEGWPCTVVEWGAMYRKAGDG